jgi:hypothetical protein
VGEIFVSTVGTAAVGDITTGVLTVGTVPVTGVFVGPLGIGVAKTAAVGMVSAGICGKPAQPESEIVNNKMPMISFFTI